MLTKTMLQPRSGKGFWCRLLLKKNNLKLLVQSLNWSKDITGPTGDGTVVIPFRGDHRKILAEGDIISIIGGWVPDIRKAPAEPFELVYGFIKKVKNSRTTIEIQFTDFGILLEGEAFILNEFSRPLKTVLQQLIMTAGLTPVVSLGTNPDEMVTVSATGAAPEIQNIPGSGDGDCVTGISSTTSGCSGQPFRGNVKYAWKNYCPACGKSGLLRKATPNSDLSYKLRGGGVQTPGDDSTGINCYKPAGGCDADYCPVTGYDTGGNCQYRLTPCSGGSGSDGGLVGSYAERVSDVNQGTSSNTWWDCIIEAINSSGADLEVYVKGTNCYVVQPAPSSQASLLVKDDINLLNDNVIETEADPACFNEITVNYGQSIHPKKVVARNDDMIEEYGLMKGQPIDKYGLNQKQAQAYANRQLQLLERDNGYELDCTVIGTKDWFIGLWTKVQIDDIDIIKTLFVTKFNFKIEQSPPVIDLTLNNYIPTISSGGSSSSGGGASDSTLDGIFKTAQSKFTYSHSCSDASCMERVGSGDCWAMSDYLYNKISEAGINVRIIQYATSLASNHRVVQVQNSNGVWVTPSQYSVFGHGGDQYLWTSETRENANNIIKSFTGGSNVNVTADSGD